MADMIELQPCPPYDFSKSVLRLRRVGHELYRYDGDRVFRTVRIGHNIYLAEIVSCGTVERPHLLVRLRPEVKEEELPGIRRHLARMLSADTDLLPFYRHAKNDPVLFPIVRRFYGLHLILESDPFECLVKTIIGQQLNLAFAAELTRRLIHFASPPFVWAGNLYPVFPSAEQLANLEPETLQKLQFSRRKAEYVIGVARKTASGELDFNEMDRMEDEQIIERLSALRGVGRWTAECFMLFGLGRSNLLPAADIGLRNAVKASYGLGEQPDEHWVRQLGQTWSPWCSYATFYLWETLAEKGDKQKMEL